MSYLLDTNAWIMYWQGNPKTPQPVRDILDHRPAECWISTASIWEAAIKVGIGKLDLPYSLSDDMPRMFEETGFRLLDLSFEDVTEVEVLPHHHRDPFDRVQAMQCLRRDWKIVSRDPVFDRYGIPRIWD